MSTKQATDALAAFVVGGGVLAGLLAVQIWAHHTAQDWLNNLLPGYAPEPFALGWVGALTSGLLAVAAATIALTALMAARPQEAAETR